MSLSTQNQAKLRVSSVRQWLSLDLVYHCVQLLQDNKENLSFVLKHRRALVHVVRELELKQCPLKMWEGARRE